MKHYEVLIFEVFDGGFYTKIKALLTDNTELYIREYSDIMERGTRLLISLAGFR